MIYHAFVTLENDHVISVLKRQSRAKMAVRSGSLRHLPTLKSSSALMSTPPALLRGWKPHWRERFLTGETLNPGFRGSPAAELRDYFSEIGIKSFGLSLIV